MIRYRGAAQVLLVWVLLGGAALAQKVAKLEIQGLERVQRVAVEALLSTREGAPFDGATLENDFRRVMDLGLFDIEKSEASVARGADGFAITLKLVENPVIAGVEVRGVNLPVIDQARVREAAEQSYRTGEIFSLREAPVVDARVRLIYQEAGYDAEVSPPAIVDGIVYVVVSEVAIERVELLVYPTDSYLDVEAVRGWIGLRPGSALNYTQLNERFAATLRLGLFSAVTVDLLPGERVSSGRILRFTCMLEPRPVPTAEACAFVNPARVLAGLDVYRRGSMPISRILTPLPTSATISSLRNLASEQPTDGRRAAELSLALARMGLHSEALEAASRAVSLLDSADRLDPDDMVLLARAALITGDASRAYAVLETLRQSNELPPAGFPALVHAAACLLADAATTSEQTARRPGDNLAWIAKTLILATQRSELLATDAGTAYSAAAGSAWRAFAQMNTSDLGANHEAYERLLGVFALLETTAEPFAPSLVVPECADAMATPLGPVLDNPRLVEALEARTDDNEARYAWASCIAQRELAAALETPPPPLKTPTDLRSQQLQRVQAVLPELLAADPDRYAQAAVLMAMAYLAQGAGAEALSTLAAAMDEPEVRGADQLYLLAASLFASSTARSQDDYLAGLAAAADRLGSSLSDGAPHPRVRYARYSLLGTIGRLDEAIQEANALIASGVSDPAAWASSGFFQAKKGNLVEAEAALKRALDLNPSDVYAAYVLGLVRWMSSGDPVASLPLLKRVEDDSAIDIAARDLAF